MFITVMHAAAGVEVVSYHACVHVGSRCDCSALWGELWWGRGERKSVNRGKYPISAAVTHSTTNREKSFQICTTLVVRGGDEMCTCVCVCVCLCAYNRRMLEC